MQIRIAPALFCASLLVAAASISAGCKKEESAPAPAPAAATDQPQGAPTSTGAQAPAVPDSAEPPGSQVQFK